MQPPERRGQEYVPFSPMRKVGLETPIVGRFTKENRRLIFAPPVWYDRLVAGVAVAGAFLCGTVLFPGLPGAVLPLESAMVTGPLLLFAAAWAYLSNERLIFDLTRRTYMRLLGTVPIVKRYVGTIPEIDAVVLISEVSPLGAGVAYRIVIHWKGRRLPVFVADRQNALVTPGSPLQAGAGQMAARGAAFAQALGVPFYDNSYFSSPGPVPVM